MITNIFFNIRRAKILLVPPKCELIMMLSNYFFENIEAPLIYSVYISKEFLQFTFTLLLNKNWIPFGPIKKL